MSEKKEGCEACTLKPGEAIKIEARVNIETGERSIHSVEKIPISEVPAAVRNAVGYSRAYATGWENCFGRHPMAKA